MKYSGYQLLIKKCLDRFSALIIMLISLPFFVLIAIVIKLNSRGPVFFTQERVGYNQCRFQCYKFRTMYVGVSDIVHQEFIKKLMVPDMKVRSEVGEVYKITDDRRVTSVGKILRKFSMDELPQILNVLKGEMSLVGPRPAIDYELQYHDQAMLRRFTVIPGITGLWQVSSRYSVDYKKMVALDLHYIEHWSLLLDLMIILKTIPVVLKINQSY